MRARVKSKEVVGDLVPASGALGRAVCQRSQAKKAATKTTSSHQMAALFVLGGFFPIPERGGKKAREASAGYLGTLTVSVKLGRKLLFAGSVGFVFCPAITMDGFRRPYEREQKRDF